ncbi:hypothetical protein NL676_022830 [Syzygium grande]|nr:hypothetical protein NL676_022830 [Syzygium grande]
MFNLIGATELQRRKTAASPNNRSESVWGGHRTCGEEGGVRRKWERTGKASEARAGRAKRKRERGARQKRKWEGALEDRV